MTSRSFFAGVLFAAIAWAQGPAPNGIMHVAFRVTDIQKTSQFYQKLGFEQAITFEDAGKVSVAFMKVNDRQFIEMYPRTADSQPLGLMHICFETSDVEALRNEYIKRDLKPAKANKGRAGNLVFSIHDPEGQTVEFLQFLPGSVHAEGKGKFLGEHRISQHLLRAVTTVRNLDAERDFYIEKLDLKSVGGSGAVRLRVPGNSGDEVGMESGSGAKPGIVFEVANVKSAAKDLRGRGFTVEKGAHQVWIADPDGARIAFAKAVR